MVTKILLHAFHLGCLLCVCVCVRRRPSARLFFVSQKKPDKVVKVDVLRGGRKATACMLTSCLSSFTMASGRGGGKGEKDRGRKREEEWSLRQLGSGRGERSKRSRSRRDGCRYEDTYEYGRESRDADAA